MDITIEQAKAFDAVARMGTIQKAAQFLKKGHSAVLYLIKSLEEQVGLELFDRSGYRNQISKEGEVVLKYCRQLIATKDELKIVCDRLKSEWEPSIKMFYDGVVDFNLIGEALLKLNKSQVPTEVTVHSAHLHEVVDKFEKEKADLMVTILPVDLPDVSSISLPPIKMLLVAHKNHLLSQFTVTITSKQLSEYSYINVRETPGHLGMSTEQIKFSSSISVNDFATKKEAILSGLGFGWLPEYIIKRELKEGSIKILNTEITNKVLFKPKLFHRNFETLGKTTEQIINHFKG